MVEDLVDHSKREIYILNKGANSSFIFADCSLMNPVGPMESMELVTMTKKFVEAGCKAFGFAEGKSYMLKVQA